jgi:hypothetical protein
MHMGCMSIDVFIISYDTSIMCDTKVSALLCIILDKRTINCNLQMYINLDDVEIARDGATNAVATLTKYNFIVIMNIIFRDFKV